MPLGEKLCNARLAMKETTSQVAAATRMKVQIVEDLEKEDFRRLAAPIYAKGFIKLYAEHVGLDPTPLIDEYMAKHQGGASDAPRVRKILRRSEAIPGNEEEAESSERDLFDYVPDSTQNQPPADIPELTDRKNARADTSQLSSASDAASAFIKRIVDTCRGCIESLASLAERQRLQNRPAGLNKVSVSIAAAVLLVLVLIAVAVTQCRPTEEELSTAIPPQPEELRVAVEPPPPYFD